MQTRVSPISQHVLSLCAGIATLSGCGGTGNLPSSSAGWIGSEPLIPQSRAVHAARTTCSQARPDEAACLALVVNPKFRTAVSGWAPVDFQTRYRLPTQKGLGQVVAIVDAYDNPNLNSDLATYRSHFKLGTASFYKYNQNGQQGNYPPGSTGWGLEEDLDAEMVSATCPKCTIYLVEANTNTGADLEAAEVEAVKLGSHIVSNSWICYGSFTCVHERYFDTRGVEYLGAGGAGSDQLGAPAIFDTVASIGGTQLSKSGSHYSESIGPSSGGCATGIKKPMWQSIIPNSVCAYRITNDASAEAGCSPGVAEYNSYGYGGWITVCGTSVAASLLAGIFGLAGNATQQKGGRTFWQAKHHKDLYMIGGQCSGYMAGQYTTCAGWGSPNGTGAF